MVKLRALLVLIACMASSALGAIKIDLSSAAAFTVMSYGAVGDGQTDDSQAFLRAWKAVCGAAGVTRGILLIPARTFLLKPVSFNGPCKPSKVYLQVSGKIIGPSRKSDWNGLHTNAWLTFAYINGLTVSGSGQIDGQGPIWWPNACIQASSNGATCHAPAALTFNRCNGLRLNGLTHKNSPRGHIILTTCNGVIFSNLRIIAPETSPNTDGIDISGSTNVQIRNSIIGTGDDCIAVSGGSSNINITGITCGPGHGISIGALGHGGYDVVEDVHVRNSILKGTLTGVRIKSWQGGSGYARKISFENIKFIAVNNPIQIDQFYCPTRVNCRNFTSAVKLSDITYKGITGTSIMDNVINLSCSQSVACTNILMDHVYIKPAIPGRQVFASCFNAHGISTHVKPLVKCLLH